VHLDARVLDLRDAEAKALVQPSRRVVEQHAEPDRNAACPRGVHQVADQLRADAAALCPWRQRDHVEDVVIRLVDDAEIADRRAVRLDNLELGIVELRRRAPALVGLVPAPDLLDVRPERGLSGREEEVPIVGADRADPDTARRISPPG
jgi:hypothetical protein